MSRTGLEVFDKTLQETNQWLKLMMEELDTDNRRLAFSALRAGLHALRDRIGPANAVHLGAQLPMLLRGAYYEGWRLAGTPTHERHYEDFLVHVDAMLPDTLDRGSEAVARATFAVLQTMLDAREFKKILHLLPKEMRKFWPEAGTSAESLHLL